MPIVEIGGVEKNFLIIANSLSKKFNNISVVSLSFSIKKKLNKGINFIGPKTNIFDKLSRRIKFIITLFYLTLSIMSERKSLVLCFQGNMYCVFVCKLLGVKVILRSNSSPSGWSKSKIKKNLYKLGFKLADGIIVNSIQFKKQLKKKFNVKAQCIYNPLNQGVIRELSKKKIKFSFFKRKYLNIINVGRLESQKDQFTLIKAINEINHLINIKLLIIGNGSKQMELQKLIKQFNLQNNIKILNNVTNPFPYINRSNLFILTSLYEGLPNVLLEALSLNKFVISTNCPTGPAEILSNGKGGTLVPLKNYKKLGKQILFFNNKKKLHLKKIAFAKKNLIRFDHYVNINKYFDYIQKFI